MSGIDFTTDHGKRALERLQSEPIIWITTTSPNGTPQPSPVWFDWQDDHVVIYSQPNTGKTRGIARNPNVSLNFNSDTYGNNVVVFRGVAENLGTDTPATSNNAFIGKYAESIAGMNWTPERFAGDYSALIRVRLTHLRGH